LWPPLDKQKSQTAICAVECGIMERIRGNKQKVVKTGKGGQFGKGDPRPPNSGAKVGQTYKPTMNRKVKEAMINGAIMVGSDNRGRDGLDGYFAFLAWKHPQVFGRLIERVMPTQIEGKLTGDIMTGVYETYQDVVESLKARGLPPPSSLIDVSPPKPKRGDPVTIEHEEYSDNDD
jgi:hypothetical protein